MEVKVKVKWKVEVKVPLFILKDDETCSDNRG